MSKYSRRENVKEPRKWKVHPIWRGIGLFFLILIPIMGYAGAVEFIQFNERTATVPLPYQMYQPTGFVGIVAEEAGNVPIGFYVSVKLGIVIFTGIFAAVGFGFYTFVYALIYRMVAPPRYVGYDSPPVGKYRPPPERGRAGRRH